VDAVDLNFGCPQQIAKKGRYGAFLLDEPDVMVSLVDTLARNLQVPVTAKLRMLHGPVEGTVELCQRLEAAGASVLCLHGRTREQNKQRAGAASWDAVAEVVERVGVPVIANGGIATADDVDACLAHTGAAAVMSSEALLENPALFCRNIHPTTGERLDQHTMARAYLSIAAQHPVAKGNGMLRPHLFKMLHRGLQQHVELRDELLVTATLKDVVAVSEKLRVLEWDQPRFHTPEYSPQFSWYARHRYERSDAQKAATGDAEMPPPSRDALAAAALAKRQKKREGQKKRRNAAKALRKQSRSESRGAQRAEAAA